MNKEKSYALVDEETNKIIEYLGRIQYSRLKQNAIIQKNKLQYKLGIKIEIRKLKDIKKSENVK